MQREIKFRVWSEKQKEMSPVVVSLLHIALAGEMAEKKKERSMIDLLKDVIFLEYTGMKDKNGKEVYEGDIIKYDYGDEDIFIEKVVFEECCFQSIEKEVEEDSYVRDPAGYLLAGVEENGEVIGNIYENPELYK